VDGCGQPAAPGVGGNNALRALALAAPAGALLASTVASRKSPQPRHRGNRVQLTFGEEGKPRHDFHYAGVHLSRPYPVGLGLQSNQAAWRPNEASKM
jgi:hypothetical protein